ncbi:hypothetical protein ACXR6G_06950 [Ancylomarina sp. YFZ004]
MAILLKLFLALFVIRISIVNYIKYSTSFPIDLPSGLEFIGTIGAILFLIFSLYGIRKFHWKVFHLKPLSKEEFEDESKTRHTLIGLTLVILLISGLLANVLAMSIVSMGGLINQIIGIISLCAALFFMIAGFISFAK